MSTAKEIKYLFIDGACLDDILRRIGKEFFNGEKVELLYSNLGHGYDKVFYYDALPRQNKGESNNDFNKRLIEKESFLNQLKILDKFHVYEGVVLERKEKLTQKAVDIMIAVDMLRHSFRKNMDKATLLTGDLDFKPLLDALVLEGMYTTIMYDPRITSRELLYAADSNQVISLNTIYHHSTELFKKSHPAPSLFQGDYTSMLKKYTIKINNGRLNQDEISLYMNDINNDYMLIHFPKNKGIMFATFNDVDYLKRWFEYEHNEKIIWD